MGGKRLRLYYMAQFETSPPRFAVQVNNRGRVTRDYAFFLENRLRDRYGLQGVPLVIDFKTSRRPLLGERPGASGPMCTLPRLMTTQALSDNEYLFTSESVTEGHPDKMADQISDGVLDAVMAEDPAGRVACETLVNTGLVVVSGEITTDTYVDIPKIARETIRRIGYSGGRYGFDCESCAVITAIDEQSPDIAQGVDKAFEARTDPADDDELDVAGAGDQGMMFGYATRETKELMPLPISLAHKLAHRLAEVRRADVMPYLGPDGKTQVTVRYENGRPIEIERILISTQHKDGVDAETLIKPDLWEHVVHPILPAELYDEKKLHDSSGRNFLVNPTGKFVIGGPVGDAGLTGRKIIVDTYGGAARHGGGAFSGKDPSKVDRSAAYAARYVAKNVVAAGLADRCEVQVAYAIGVAHPVSVMVETFGTERVGRSTIAELVEANFDLRPGAFREYLNLHRPIYQKTAAYGHFGREDADFTWEKTDKADALRDGRRPRRAAGRAGFGLALQRAAVRTRKTPHLALHALEAAAAGERPAVVAGRRLAHLGGGHHAAAAGERGQAAGQVHRPAVPVAGAGERVARAPGRPAAARRPRPPPGPPPGRARPGSAGRGPGPRASRRRRSS